MAIQMRRGQLANYDKNKMLAGEWGIAVDSDTERQKAFIAFGPGIDKEVMFVEDAAERITEATVEATEEAEAWAVGTKSGTDVPSTDPQYHNNAKYYADQMGTISSDVSDLKNDMADVKSRLSTGLVVTDQGSGVVSISLA